MKKLRLAFLVLLLVLAKAINTAAQCPYPSLPCECVTINLPPDPTICPGATYVHDFTPDIIVPPGVTVLDWTWSASTIGSTITPSSGTLPLPGPTTFSSPWSTIYTLTVNAIGPNILNDADFSSALSGTPCFNTAYTPYSGYMMGMVDGTYTIDVDPAPYSPGLFGSFPDHTSTLPGPPPGPYNMFIAHGHPGLLVWEETDVPVCPDQDYAFSFWLANVTSDGGSFDAQLRVVINGVSFGPFSATGIGVWQLQSMVYHSSPLGGTVDIQIYDDQPNVKLNDFAIDDLSFNQYCHPSQSFTVNVEYPVPMGIYYGCVGSTVTMVDAPGGGTWSASTPSVAVVDAITGVATGVSPGVTGIVYTTPEGCTSSTTLEIFDCTDGVAFGTQTSLCEGQSTTLIGLPTGGTWTSSAPLLASIDPITGFVYAIPGAGGGVVTFTYTVGTIVKTVTLTIIPPVAACVKLSTVPDYGFDITTTCPGMAYVNYTVWDVYGNSMGYPWGYTAVVTGGLLHISLSTIYGLPTGSYPSCMWAYSICVNSVMCEGCWWPASCCASVNQSHRQSAADSGAVAEPVRNIQVVPNPNNGTFTVVGKVTGSANKNVYIDLMDMSGKIVLKEVAAIDNGMVQKCIALGSDIPDGLYIIKVYNEETNEVLRFTLSR